MLYHCFASSKQSPLDFVKLVDSRLILSAVEVSLVITAANYVFII